MSGYSGWKESFSFHIATGFGERNCFRERYPVEGVEGFEGLDSKRGRCPFLETSCVLEVE